MNDVYASDLETITGMVWGERGLEVAMSKLTPSQLHSIKHYAQSCRDTALDNIGAVARALVFGCKELGQDDVRCMGWAISDLAATASFIGDVEVMAGNFGDSGSRAIYLRAVQDEPEPAAEAASR